MDESTELPEKEKSPLKREYWAFISYKHDDNREEGRQWATWLHQALETYEVPEDLVGKLNQAGEEIPSRIFPVFRDEEELGAGSSLTERIYLALQNSRVLLVICSPRVIHSPYVEAEIRYFKSLGKEEDVYAAVIDGEPGSETIEAGKCFPDPIQYKVDSAGNTMKGQKTEPLASDFRLLDGTQGWTSSEAYFQHLIDQGEFSRKQINELAQSYADRLELAKLKLISGILKIPLGVLQKRDKAYQLRLAKKRAAVLRRWLAAVGLLAIAAVLGGYGFFVQKEEAKMLQLETAANLKEALRNEGRFYLERAKRANVPAQQVLAGKAVSFKDFGRPEKSEDNPFWEYDPFWRNEPVRLQPGKDDLAISTANNLLENGSLIPVTPILTWSSPVARHHNSVINQVVYSSDSSTIGSASGDGTIKIWDATNGRLLKSSQVYEFATCIAFSPDGNLVASGGIRSGAADWGVNILDASNDKLLHELECQSVRIAGVVFSRDGRQVLAGYSNGIVEVWDVLTGQLLDTFEIVKGGFLRKFAFSKHGGLAVFGEWNGELFVFDLEERRHLLHLKHKSPVYCVGFSNDGEFIFSSAQSEIKIWEVRTGELCHTLGIDYSPDVVVMHPRNNTLVLGGEDNPIEVWDLDKKVINKLEGHSDGVNSLAISPDGNQFVSGGNSDRKQMSGAVKIRNFVGDSPDESPVGHQDNITGVSFTPDGTRVVSCSEDNTIKIWDVHNGMLIRTLEGSAKRFRQIACNGAGDRILSASEYGSVKLWDAVEGKLLRSIEKDFYFGWDRAAAWLDDSKVVVGGSDNISIFDVKTGKAILSIDGYGASTEISEQVNCLALSPDGKHIVAGAEDKVIWVFDATDGNLLLTLKGHSDEINSVCVSPNSRRIASGSSDGKIKIWELESGRLLDTLEGHENPVWSIAFNPDGSKIVSAGGESTSVTPGNGLIKIWDSDTGNLLYTLDGHFSRVNSVDFSPDGNRLVSGGEDNTLKLWEIPNSLNPINIQEHSDNIRNLAFTVDGGRVLSCGIDNSMRLWDAQSGVLLHEFWGHSANLLSVAVSSDGTKFASGDEDGLIKLWNASKGTLIREFKGQSEGIEKITFSSKGRITISKGISGKVTFWNNSEGGEARFLCAHANSVICVKSIPMHDTFVTGHSDGKVRLWDGNAGKHIHSMDVAKNISCVALSFDGQTVASGSDDRSIEVRDARTGALRFTFVDHDAGVQCLAFSSNGRKLVSGADDTLIKVWDIIEGKLLNTLRGHASRVIDVMVTPDGSRIFSQGLDGTMKVWNCIDGSLLHSFDCPFWTPLNGPSKMIAFRQDGRGGFAWAGDKNIEVWDSVISYQPSKQWLKPSVYIKDGWAKLDPEGGDLVWSPSDSLFREKTFEFVNIPPGTLSWMLRQAETDLEKSLIMVDYHFKYRLWRAFWHHWKRLTPTAQNDRVRDVLRVFLQLSFNPPPGYTPDWFAHRFNEVHQEWPNEQFIPDLVSAMHVARLLDKTKDDLKLLEPFFTSMESSQWPVELKQPISNAWKSRWNEGNNVKGVR